MAQTPLVNRQIEDGERMLQRLSDEGVEILAALWVMEDEADAWHLYLVTPLASAARGKSGAYQRINEAVAPLRERPFWVDRFHTRVFGPDSSEGEAILRHARRFSPDSLPWTLGDTTLGFREIEGAYFYPLGVSEDVAR